MIRFRDLNNNVRAVFGTADDEGSPVSGDPDFDFASDVMRINLPDATEITKFFGEEQGKVSDVSSGIGSRLRSAGIFIPGTSSPLESARMEQRALTEIMAHQIESIAIDGKLSEGESKGVSERLQLLGPSVITGAKSATNVDPTLLFNMSRVTNRMLDKDRRSYVQSLVQSLRGGKAKDRDIQLVMDHLGGARNRRLQERQEDINRQRLAALGLVR
jgi:hypothetical protein